MRSHQSILSLTAIFLLSGLALVHVNGFFLPHAVSTKPFLSRCGATPAGQRHATTCSVSMSASGSDELSRGAWVGRALGVALSGVAVVTQGSGQAVADLGVGEGGLPDGARQFSNLVKVQKDWIALGKSIKDQGADVTPTEWKNVALFLRKVYQLGGDLEYLAGQFSGEKKKGALGLVRAIQKEVQAADVPAREKNVEAFNMAQASVEKKFGEFMDLFIDVPSEL